MRSKNKRAPTALEKRWHGERLAWTLARMDAMDAVALAVRRNFEAITTQ